MDGSGGVEGGGEGVSEVDRGRIESCRPGGVGAGWR